MPDLSHAPREVSQIRPQKSSFDLLVVGAGSGGLAAAKSAAGLGASVAVVEARRIGGTCVLRGCVPKKIMVFAASLGLKTAVAKELGWSTVTGEGDGHAWPTLCRARDRLVNNLEMAHTQHLSRAGVHTVMGQAVLRGPHKVAVQGRELSAGRILWASGSVPVLPPFPGHPLCLTSDDFFALEQMPPRALLVGGGYIAVEFASLLAALGCEVTLLVRRQLLASFDRDLADEQLHSLRRLGVDVRLGCRVERVEKAPRGASAGADVVVWARQPDGVVTAMPPQACMLCATGRRPNTSGAGLEAAGVRLADGGAIEVDADHRTACPSIFALGDVIDRVNLTPVAIRAGRTFAAQQFGDGAPPVAYELVPKAVFGAPPLGSVGLSEAEARERFGDAVRVYISRFVPLVWSPAPKEARPRALVKVLVHAGDDRVLGCHMMGEEAAESIQGFAVAMQAGITKRQLDSTFAVHPTSAEEMVLLRETSRQKRS